MMAFVAVANRIYHRVNSKSLALTVIPHYVSDSISCVLKLASG